MIKTIKQTLLKRISIITVVIVIVSLLVTPVGAAVNGSLTFSHGANKFSKYTFGKTTSTAIENSMQIYGYVYFETGPNSGSYAYYQWLPVLNTKSLTRSIYPGSIKGSSLFQYYVDGSRRHTSEEWWNFDFR